MKSSPLEDTFNHAKKCGLYKQLEDFEKALGN